MSVGNGIARTMTDVSKGDPFKLLNFNSANAHLKEVIPRVKVQYDSSHGLTKGMFTYNLDNSQKAEIRMVIMGLKFSRAMWGKFNPRAENPQPLCQSANGEYSTSGEVYPADKPMMCNLCPHPKWSNGAKPACKEVFSVLAYDVDLGLPFILQVSGTSIGSLRRAKTYLKLQAKKWLYPGCLPNCCVSMPLQARPVEGYYVLEWPTRDKHGASTWQRLDESTARELSKVAMDLSIQFAEMNESTPEVDTQNAKEEAPL